MIDTLGEIKGKTETDTLHRVGIAATVAGVPVNPITAVGTLPTTLIGHNLPMETPRTTTGLIPEINITTRNLDLVVVPTNTMNLRVVHQRVAHIKTAIRVVTKTLTVIAVTSLTMVTDINLNQSPIS